MFISLKNLFPRLINRLGFEKKIEEEKIFQLWQKSLSSLYSANFQKQTKPLKLQNKILTIGVSNSSLASELQLRQNEILENINLREDKVKKIKITLL